MTEQRVGNERICEVMKIVFYVAQVVVGAATFVVVQFGWWLLHLPYFDVLAEQRGATAFLGVRAIAISVALFVSTQLVAFITFRAFRMHCMTLRRWLL
jgi:hypothetical protein